MTDADLMPCPFCGETAHFEHDQTGWEWVECSSCGMAGRQSASLMEDCKPTLAEAWNRRENREHALAFQARRWQITSKQAKPEDKLLLEAAAKAAGYPWRGWSGWTPVLDYDLSMPEHIRIACPAPWNPLTDDGDALRLAAVLSIKIDPGKYKGDGDTLEQMRRAIVLVAANIQIAREQNERACQSSPESTQPASQ